MFDVLLLAIEMTELKQKVVKEIDMDGKYKLLEKHHGKATSLVMTGFIVAFPAAIGLLIKMVAVDVTSL